MKRRMTVLNALCLVLGAFLFFWSISSGDIKEVEDLSGPGGGALTNGDRGDVVISGDGATWTIDDKQGLADGLTVDSVAGMASLDTSALNGRSVTTRGYYTVGDGGGNAYVYRSTGRTGITADGGWYINGPGADDYFEATTKGTSLNIVQWGAKADDATDCNSVIDSVIASVGSTEVGLWFDGEFYLATGVTIPRNIALHFQPGDDVRVESGQVLTINSAVRAGHHEIFQCDSAGVVIREDVASLPSFVHSTHLASMISVRQGKIFTSWFDGTDMGMKINKALQAGGENSHVIIPPGFFKLDTTVIADESTVGSHLVLEGSGFIGSTLVIPSSSNMIGIDLYGADEVHIRNLRVIEDSGSKVSTCVRFGGTSVKVTDCWFGNAKYGILASAGSGGLIRDTYVEHCQYGIFVASRYNDPGAGVTGSTNIRELQIAGGLLYSNDIHNLHVQNYHQVTVNVTGGAFSDGEVASGIDGSITIINRDDQGGGVEVWTIDKYGDFIPVSGNALAGETGGDTATVTASNGNLVANTAVKGLLIDCNTSDTTGIGVYARQTSNLDLDVTLFQNSEGGSYFRDCDGLRLTGTADRNIGHAITVVDSTGVISGFSSRNATGSDQTVDIAISGSDMVIDGNYLGSATPVVGTFTAAAAALLGEGISTPHDVYKLDGSGDYVTFDVGTLWADEDEDITVEFVMHDSGTVDGYLFSFGASGTTDGVYGLILNNEVTFHQTKTSANRTAICGAPQLGTYVAAFDKTAGTVTVTKPDGTTVTDSTSSYDHSGYEANNDADFWIGRRAVSPTPVPADSYWDGAVSQFVIKGNSNQIKHTWNGYGATAADWEDQTQSVDGTVGGTAGEVLALP